METSMVVDFQILQKINGEYIPISNKEAKAVSIGGFGFEINGAEIPFDWDAFTGTECNKVFQFQTGKGFLFDDYEISDCYDESFEEIGIAKEDTYAFGDSANDVEMLEFVAHGIAMGNGTDVAKNAAEFITTDIHKDGIWNGLKHYGLI